MCQSGGFGEEKNVLHLPGLETRTFQPVALSEKHVIVTQTPHRLAQYQNRRKEELVDGLVLLEALPRHLRSAL
jgi:hypothetical protein